MTSRRYPVVLSDAEKERIRESETLKAEIRKELEPSSPPSRLSDFQKQTLLLLLGFVLTTVAGGLLAAFWKSRDSTNQRSYLAQQRAIDKKYALVDKTAKEVAITVAAADDVLITYYGEEWSTKQIDERRTNWERTSRNWRVNSQVLSEELAAAFSTPEIAQSFQEIMQKRTLLGNAITNLPKGKKEIESDKNLKQELDDANKLKLKIIDLLHKCGSAMTVEAKQVAID
jgi:hypothetical protein